VCLFTAIAALAHALADDDYAVAVLAEHLHKPANVTNFYRERALSAPFTMFNNNTGFMEARNANGSWAGSSRVNSDLAVTHENS
jgi:putative alpha-1,2-mannosidase